MVLEKKSILIVDDDKRILYTMKKALENADYNLFFADSGDNAFTILKKEKIDLALVDLRMPIISGYEILETIKKSYPSVLRLALIGYVDEKKIMDALSNNIASSYIIKPWNNFELLNTINYYFNLYSELKTRGILERINNISSLPTIPKIYFKITKAVEEDADMEEISELIEMDHSISARVIQIVNSAYFNIRTGFILTITNIFKCRTKIFSNKTFCSGYKYIHYFAPFASSS